MSLFSKSNRTLWLYPILGAIIFSILQFSLGWFAGASYIESESKMKMYAVFMTIWLVIFVFFMPLSILICGFIYMKTKAKKLRVYLAFLLSVYIIYFCAGSFRWYIVQGFSNRAVKSIKIDGISQWLGSLEKDEKNYFVDYDTNMLPEAVSCLNPRYSKLYNDKDKKALLLIYGGLCTRQFGLVILGDNISDISEVGYESYVFKKLSKNVYVWVGYPIPNPLIYPSLK